MRWCPLGQRKQREGYRRPDDIPSARSLLPASIERWIAKIVGCRVHLEVSHIRNGCDLLVVCHPTGRHTRFPAGVESSRPSSALMTSAVLTESTFSAAAFNAKIAE